ncbi:SUMF1/EgtB/PvdO family nonheme iron enzyme [Zoogloea sp.]|uniref:SUMF1/EgtB/PvdO family nonheme iron enzyme n=1 Tax=Zoogloea sp. TaxID=49181 RepID=UPI0034341C8F
MRAATPAGEAQRLTAGREAKNHEIPLLHHPRLRPRRRARRPQRLLRPAPRRGIKPAFRGPGRRQLLGGVRGWVEGSVFPPQSKREWVDYPMLRGGSWNNNGRNCRAANRNRNEPGNRNNNIGFRLPQLKSRRLRL